MLWEKIWWLGFVSKMKEIFISPLDPMLLLKIIFVLVFVKTVILGLLISFIWGKLTRNKKNKNNIMHSLNYALFWVQFSRGLHPKFSFYLITVGDPDFGNSRSNDWTLLSLNVEKEIILNRDEKSSGFFIFDKKNCKVWIFYHKLALYLFF